MADCCLALSKSSADAPLFAVGEGFAATPPKLDEPVATRGVGTTSTCLGGFVSGACVVSAGTEAGAGGLVLPTPRIKYAEAPVTSNRRITPPAISILGMFDAGFVAAKDSGIADWVGTTRLSEGVSTGGL